MKLVQTIKTHNEPVTSLKFSPNGKMIASACITTLKLASDSTVAIYLISTTRIKNNTTRLLGHTKAVLDLCWAKDSTHVCTASQDNTLKIWSINKITRVEHINKNESDMNKNEDFNNDSLDESLENTLIKTLKGHTQPVFLSLIHI
jgi:WD40 repeat protein